MAPKKNISLDDILAQKRRKDASSLATAIMGKKNPEKGKPVIKKATAGSPALSPASSRISKTSKVPGTSISPNVARSLQNNKLFTALHTEQVSVKTGPIPVGPAARRNGIPVGPAASVARRPQYQQQQRPQRQQRPEPPQIKGLASGAGGNGFSIRGSAGPTVVHATNFAPGTTSEDIRHAMAPLGKILHCMILSAQPTVIAEIVFEKKEAAEKCIEQYNNQRADGRLLHIYLKNGPPSVKVPSRVDNYGQPRSPSPLIDPYRQREEADRLRREANVRVTFQDGRYGVKPPPLYSDAFIQKGRGFGY
ncbi:hypothetical protein EX30DRAFT_337373 [Ascodesmis nigricans]|uniref:RRM domain-containing protein n=1 Tax=Ascodesmis nigricans TaxID=341454 RepID=A0A4S2N6H2_9PEZI|nr:hypothetical protein EX30DRAFT_337373 [Ascodesmis nigricans]